MRYLTALAAAAVILLAACSSTSSPGHPAASGGAGAPPATSSAPALAKRLGCRHYKPTVPPGLYTREEGACTLHGQQVVLATFGNTDAQRAWVQAETTLGGVLVQGTRWAANAPTSADARKAAAKLGGRLTG